MAHLPVRVLTELQTVEFMNRRPPKNFHPEPFEYHQEVELQISDLTNLGSGVGRLDGWVVFVPYALPGERIKARIWRNKSNYSDADLLEVLEASPDRTEPQCGLFGICGGCQYQHYSYEKQLEWKTHQIGEGLKRIGKLELPVNPCIGSPLQYGYRSKITPHFRESPAHNDAPIGFQQVGSRALVDVEQCPIASPAINERFPAAREELRSGKRSFKRGGTLLLRDADEGVVSEMSRVATESVGPYRFSFVAGEFFQNNPHILPKMVNYALERATEGGTDYLVDAYCGVGVFGISGSKRFKAVHGVEVSPKAVDLANENAQVNQVHNIQFTLGHAEAIFAGLTFPPEHTTVLLDPPRKGCDASFIRQLLNFAPKRIVYVSCGPDTQARDAQLICEGPYRVCDVQPFDLFPQTRHIENVMTFESLS